MSKKAKDLLSAHHKIGIVQTSSHGSFDKHIIENELCVLIQINTDSNFVEIAQKLYSVLRDLDSQKVDFILFQGITEQGLGSSVMNRLKKAATKIIDIDN
jgi:L-threonylcarbamoyladenylate synthase